MTADSKFEVVRVLENKGKGWRSFYMLLLDNKPIAQHTNSYFFADMLKNMNVEFEEKIAFIGMKDGELHDGFPKSFNKHSPKEVNYLFN